MILKHKQSTRGSKRMSGYSIIEMVLFLAILGIICGLGIIQFAVRQQGTVDETRYKRNAQEIAAVCTTAQAAGLEFIANGDLVQTIKNVIQGGTPKDGPFRGTLFAVKGLVNADVNHLTKYLALDSGMLIYKAGS